MFELSLKIFKIWWTYFTVRKYAKDKEQFELLDDLTCYFVSNLRGKKPYEKFVSDYPPEKLLCDSLQSFPLFYAGIRKFLLKCGVEILTLTGKTAKECLRISLYDGNIRVKSFNAIEQYRTASQAVLSSSRRRRNGARLRTNSNRQVQDVSGKLCARTLQ